MMGVHRNFDQCSSEMILTWPALRLRSTAASILVPNDVKRQSRLPVFPTTR